MIDFRIGGNRSKLGILGNKLFHNFHDIFPRSNRLMILNCLLNKYFVQWYNKKIQTFEALMELDMQIYLNQNICDMCFYRNSVSFRKKYIQMFILHKIIVLSNKSSSIINCLVSYLCEYHHSYPLW